jgi:hypothetical protein
VAEPCSNDHRQRLFSEVTPKERVEIGVKMSPIFLVAVAAATVVLLGAGPVPFLVAAAAITLGSYLLGSAVLHKVRRFFLKETLNKFNQNQQTRERFLIMM